MNEIAQALPVGMPDGLSENAKPKNIMGKDDFLKLFLTQLQHQDPLKPMDHQEMGAQMAQFSSLEQLTNIGKGIQSLRDDRGEDAKMAALSMIGKRVSATGNEVQLMEAGSVALGHSLPKDVTPTKAMIYDGAGKLVRELTPQKGESGEMIWDGKDDQGQRLPVGKYSFRVQGVNGQGQSQDAPGGINGLVSGVEMDGKTPMLILQTSSGKTRLEISRVRQVSLDEIQNTTKPAPPTPQKLVEAVTEAPDAVAAAEVEDDAVIPDESSNWRSNNRMGERL